MAIVFPASPSVNDTFTVGSITYKWDGAKWIGLGVTPADRLVEGSNSLEIDASNNLVWTGGKVGIGTGIPDYSLTIGDGSSYVIQNLKSKNDEFGEFRFGDPEGIAQGKITYDHDTDSLRFTTNGDGEKLRITSDGKVGVNQVTPIAIFHAKSGANDGTLVSTFEGATDNKLNIRFDTFGPVLDVTAGDPLAFEIGGSERLRITSTGMLTHTGGYENNSGGTNMSAGLYNRINAFDSVPVSNNRIYTFSGLSSGWMTIKGGGYSNAGQSQFAVMYQLGGYMTATNKYDVVTVQQWGSGATISVTKNGTSFDVTITNNSATYELQTWWCVEGSNTGIKIVANA